MKITVNNLGPIKTATLEIKKLNVLFGANNGGKTYITYAIWALINKFKKDASIDIPQGMVQKLLDNGSIPLDASILDESKITKHLLREYNSSISKIFSAADNAFDGFSAQISSENLIEYNHSDKPDQIRFGKNAVLNLSVIREDDGNYSLAATSTEQIDPKIPAFVIGEILGRILAQRFMNIPFDRAFAITSERTAVSLFYKNLDYKKSEALDYIMKNKKFNAVELIEKINSRYALPIQENIDFVRDYDAKVKTTSYIFKESEKYKILIEIWKDLLGGSFSYDQDTIMYRPHNANVDIPIYLTSSSVKSLFIIEAYLRHEIDKNDILFIDEPELNLSPKNQVKMAKFLIALCDAGIKIFVTTHSDYISREINLELNRRIDKDDISIYTIDDNSNVIQVPVDDSGFSVSVFDDVVREQLERGFNND